MQSQEYFACNDGMYKCHVWDDYFYDIIRYKLAGNFEDLQWKVNWKTILYRDNYSLSKNTTLDQGCMSIPELGDQSKIGKHKISQGKVRQIPKAAKGRTFLRV